jgi:inner membrane protein YidH
MWVKDRGRRPPAAHEAPRASAGEETQTDASGPGSPAPPSSAGPSSAGPGSGGAGSEPDARFTFANERTFLAWIRTALALVAAGLATVQLLPPFHGIRWGRHALGIPLILLGAVVAVRSYQEWGANQRAIRQGGPLRRSWLPELLAVVIALVAAGAAALALVSG